MPAKRKYPTGTGWTPGEQTAQFHNVKSVNFYTDGDKTFQVALTFRDEDPLIGIQKLWFDAKSNEWKYSKKSVFMNVEAWKELVKRVDEFDKMFTPLIEHPPNVVKKNSRPPPPEVGGSSTTCSSSAGVAPDKDK